jgi:ribosomal protein S20
MPILKHAKKKLKQDKKRTLQNKKIKEVFKRLVKTATEDKKPESVSKAFSALDKAVKKNLLNKNKVARMKSALTKHAASDTVKVATKKVTAKAKKAAKVAKLKKISSAKAAKTATSSRKK